MQPAPRITTAPIPNSSMNHRFGNFGTASATPHQQGIKSSHVPIGRSSRISRA